LNSIIGSNLRVKKDIIFTKYKEAKAKEMKHKKTSIEIRKIENDHSASFDPNDLAKEIEFPHYTVEIYL